MSKIQEQIAVTKHASELSSILMEEVRNSIVVIRDTPVIADSDVASLYVIETKHINQTVRSNSEKFPEDNMFVLTGEEATDLGQNF